MIASLPSVRVEEPADRRNRNLLSGRHRVADATTLCSARDRVNAPRKTRTTVPGPPAVHRIGCTLVRSGNVGEIAERGSTNQNAILAPMARPAHTPEAFESPYAWARLVASLALMTFGG